MKIQTNVFVCDIFMNEVLYKYSGIPHIIKTDTQGCGAGLADAKLSPFIDITLFDTEAQNKTKINKVST